MNRVEVRLHGHAVASLTSFGDEFDTHEFAPHRGWIRAPGHAVLGQLWEDRGARSLTTHGLTPWFEHLLPRGPMRRSIAREAGVDEDDGLALLVWLSGDLLGAVTLGISSNLPYVSRPARPLSVATEDARYRCSLPGTQWKLSLIQGGNGFALPARGTDGDWIAKFPTGNFPRLVEVEAATMGWALACGIRVPEVREESVDRIEALPAELPCDGGKVYLIRRFDRSGGARVHTEDFGQILDTPPGPELFGTHYEVLAAVIVRLCPREDLRAFLKQLVFCMLVGNFDAHTKNWSVVYEDRRHPRLSPAYDLIATVVYPELKPELALRLGGTRSSRDLRDARFTAMASVLGIDVGVLSGWVREDVESVRDAWSRSEVCGRFSEIERRRINAHLARCETP